VGKRGVSDEQILVELWKRRSCAFATCDVGRWWCPAARDRRCCTVRLDAIGNELKAVSELLRSVFRCSVHGKPGT